MGHGEHPGYLSGYGAGAETYEKFNSLFLSEPTSKKGNAAIAELGTHALGKPGARTEDPVATIENGVENTIYRFKESTTSQKISEK